MGAPYLPAIDSVAYLSSPILPVCCTISSQQNSSGCNLPLRFPKCFAQLLAKYSSRNTGMGTLGTCRCLSPADIVIPTYPSISLHLPFRPLLFVECNSDHYRIGPCHDGKPINSERFFCYFDSHFIKSHDEEHHKLELDPSLYGDYQT